MTSPSRKKRPTTVPAPTATPATGRKVLAACAVALALAGVSSLAAQDWRGQPPGPLPYLQPTQHILPPTPGAGGGAVRPQPRPQILPVQGLQPVRQVDSDTSPISLDIPQFMRIFNRLDTEAALQERIRQEGRERDPTEPERNIIFPDEVTLTKEQYPGRNWPRQMAYAEPNFVVHRRLYFQELNSERYGWDLGPISPLASSLYFFRDVALFPYRFGTDLCRCYDSNAGYCLPGDPVPYLLYPVEASWTGTATEAATLVVLLAAFP
jgi:hypothetical protein